MPPQNVLKSLEVTPLLAGRHSTLSLNGAIHPVPPAPPQGVLTEIPTPSSYLLATCSHCQRLCKGQPSLLLGTKTGTVSTEMTCGSSVVAWLICSSDFSNLYLRIRRQGGKSPQEEEKMSLLEHTPRLLSQANCCNLQSLAAQTFSN